MDSRINWLGRLLAVLLCLAGSAAAAQELDYSRAIHLDAEGLAEQGMAEAYAQLLPALKAYVVAPLVLNEKVDSDRGIYTVMTDGHSQRIFPSPLGGDQYETWASDMFPN